MNTTIQDIFKALPQRFKADKAKDYQGIFHFVLETAQAQSIYFTVEIAAGKCTVSDALHGEPTCSIKSDTQTYLDIELGNTTAQEAILSGKINIDNLAEMMHFSKLFHRYSPAESHQALVGAASRKPTGGPLKGLKILDFTRLLPGPLATMMLADMGAEVIKIEAPNFYDYARDFPPHKGGESAGYLAFNRSKRSLSLDYTTPEGKAIILDMVKEADILIEQFRPGVMKKMGLDYESLQKINPKIIYVAITGYGQTGPYAQLAGHDLNYITLAGLLSGNQNEAPRIPIVQMADIAGGSYMSIIACLSAVYALQKTGKGQFVDVSMMDGVMPLSVNAKALQWMTGKNVQRDEGFLSGGLINYNIYPTKDERYIALGTLETKFWDKFCEIIKKPDWKNRMFEQDPAKSQAHKAELTALFKTQTASYWSEMGLEHDLLINTVYEQDEIDKDPQVIAREMVIEQEHPTAGKIKSIGVPLKFSETKATPSWAPPLLGEDTLAILTEAGLSPEMIQMLANKGVLKMQGEK